MTRWNKQYTVIKEDEFEPLIMVLKQQNHNMLYEIKEYESIILLQKDLTELRRTKDQMKDATEFDNKL